MYAVFNSKQTLVVVSTLFDVLYVDIPNKKEIDIDNLYKIAEIRSIVYIGNHFYVLANKCERLLGYFLIQIDEVHPDVTQPTLLINCKSKLDISDAALFQF